MIPPQLSLSTLVHNIGGYISDADIQTELASVVANSYNCLTIDDLIQLKNVICNETTSDAMKRVTILAICGC